MLLLNFESTAADASEHYEPETGTGKSTREWIFVRLRTGHDKFCEELLICTAMTLQ